MQLGLLVSVRELSQVVEGSAIESTLADGVAKVAQVCDQVAEYVRKRLVQVACVLRIFLENGASHAGVERVPLGRSPE